MTRLLVWLLAAAPPSTEVVRALDLGRLSFAEANQLDGKSVRVSFVVATVPDVLARAPSADAAGDRSAARSVRVAPGVRVGNLKPGQRLTVEGVLRIRLIVHRWRPLVDRWIEVREARPVSL